MLRSLPQVIWLNFNHFAALDAGFENQFLTVGLHRRSQIRRWSERWFSAPNPGVNFSRQHEIRFNWLTQRRTCYKRTCKAKGVTLKTDDIRAAKRSSLYFIVLLCSACTPAGEEGGACLENLKCNPGLVCRFKNLCQVGRDIRLSNHLTLVSEVGSTTKPNWSDAGPRVYMVTDGGFTEFSLQRDGDDFVSTSFQEGEYVIRYNDTWAVTSADNVELGSTEAGRFNAVTVDAGALALTVVSTGLGTWQIDDSLGFFSLGAGTPYEAASDGNGITAGPSVGSPADQFTIDYGLLSQYGYVSMPLVDSRQGDSLWMTQLRNTSLETTFIDGGAFDGGTLETRYECSTITAAAHLTNVLLVPPQTAISAAFAGSPTELNVALPRGDWNSIRAQLNLGAVINYESYSVSAQPVSGHAVSAAPYVVSCGNVYFGSAPPLLNLSQKVRTVNAFPASWALFQNYYMTFRTTARIPDAGTYSSSGFVSAQRPMSEPLTLSTGPVISVRVNGIALDELTSLPASAPVVVSWQAPTSAQKPTQYFASVQERQRSGTPIVNGVILPRDTAVTPNLSFTFPPGTLKAGRVYIIRVEARQAAFDAQKNPLGFSETPSYSQVQVFSNPFLAK
jgi:hypothetical protein